MSFEKAANPNKMASYLSAFNSANLGKVVNTGTIENAKSDVNTILNNAAAEDTKSEMYYKGLASEATRDHRAEMAGIQQDANRFGAIAGGVSAIGAGAIKGSGFSLFDKGTGLPAEATAPTQTGVNHFSLDSMMSDFQKPGFKWPGQ